MVLVMMLNTSIEGEDSSIQQPSVEELWIISGGTPSKVRKGKQIHKIHFWLSFYKNVCSFSLCFEFQKKKGKKKPDHCEGI